MNNNYQIPFKPTSSTFSSVTSNNTSSPSQEELVAKAEEIIAPKKSKVKIILTSLVAFLLLGSVAGAVILVRQNQDIRKQAADECPTVGAPVDTCVTDCPSGKTGTCGGHTYCVWTATGNVVGDCQCETESQTCTISTPPPPGGCDGTNATCTNDDTCCSKVCSFGKCAGGCSSFGEGECWTHANCHWESGVCKDGATPSPGAGACQIDCGADRNGVSVTAKTGSEAACAGATVTAVYFAKTCNSSTSCAGATTTTKSSLPFSANTVGNDCGYYQTDINASTDKGGTCKDASAGALEPCTSSTPTPNPSATPTPTPAISCQCNQIKAYDTSWNLLTSTQLSALKAGDKVRFAVSGTASSGTIDKSRFTINGGTPRESAAKKANSQEFYYEYTIPTGVTSFSVEAEVHHVGLNQWF